MSDSGNPKLISLRNLTLCLLDDQIPAHSLRPEVIKIIELLANSGSIRYTGHEKISAGETNTADGLALSPTMAAMCADDFVRTKTFIHGTYAAIADTRKRFPDRPVRIFYAGCGPYATLAIPLMSVFSAEEAMFTLLDVHTASIESAKSITDVLGLTDHIIQFETSDAGLYRFQPALLPDIILMEIMQACLATEPQVAITRHLLHQVPNAILIPEEVQINLHWVDTSREFDLNSTSLNDGPGRGNRIPVGTAFVLNRKSVDSWKHITGDRLPGSVLPIPDFPGQRFQLMLFTNIRIYSTHLIKDYDSGLTCPRIFTCGEEINPGDFIKFHYEVGPQPRLVGKVCPAGPV